MLKSQVFKKNETRVFLNSLGPTIEKYLYEKGVMEIYRNPDGDVWLDRLGKPSECLGPIQTDEDAKRTIDIVASATNQYHNEQSPGVAGEIPELGYRFQGVMHDVVESPTWNIRIPALKDLTLDDYVKDQIMTEPQKLYIQDAIKRRKNILVVGGTQSGKSTLLNAMLSESSTAYLRHIFIQDSNELKFGGKNKVFLRSNKNISMDQCLVLSLRMSPDIIIVGEIKTGMEAKTFLFATNTGHSGCKSTIHAQSALYGLYRLEDLQVEAGFRVSPRSISQAIQVIVFIEASIEDGLKIKEIVEVKGWAHGDYILEPK